MEKEFDRGCLMEASPTSLQIQNQPNESPNRHPPHHGIWVLDLSAPVTSGQSLAHPENSVDHNVGIKCGCCDQLQLVPVDYHAGTIEGCSIARTSARQGLVTGLVPEKSIAGINRTLLWRRLDSPHSAVFDTPTLNRQKEYSRTGETYIHASFGT